MSYGNSTQGYEALSLCYDRLMDFDYEALADYYEACFFKYCSKKPVSLLDLACGTGKLAAVMADRGYDVVAVDRSEEMLNEARKNTADSVNVLLVCQDMCGLDLNDTVDCAVCSLDGINHLRPGQLQTAIDRTSLFLNKGGLFIFDVHSELKFYNTLADNVFTYDLGDLFCVWESSLDKNRLIYSLNIFTKNKTGGYTRHFDGFCEYWHSEKTILNVLGKSGLKIVDINKNDRDRIFFIAQKE